MSFFTFVKDTGAKLFGMQTSAEANTERETKIKDFVTKFELPINEFNVAVNDENATLSGKTDTQEVKEKVILAVGNIEGIAKVEDKITVNQASTITPVFYTVKSGDTLSKIAKTEYGDAMKYPQIFEANKPMLTHPDKIYPGQSLRIPQEIKMA